MRDAQSLASSGPPGTRGHGGWDNRTRVLAMGAAQVFPGQGHFRGVSQLRLSDQWNGILTD
jgi:hypothetical protein